MGPRKVLRPDGRRFVSLDGPLPAEGDLYATVDEGDDERRRYEGLGFVFNRRESHYLILTDPEITGLGGVEAPAGFVLVRADEVEVDRLRVLDDALRQDVPGTDGWKWDEAGFREEFASPSFDPATYLIAVEQASGEYTGIVRVWINPEGPRLGFVGVLPRYRRRGVARALLARALAVLHARGETEVSTEIDDANVASLSLLGALGARRTGSSIELIRRHRYSAE